MQFKFTGTFSLFSSTGPYTPLFSQGRSAGCQYACLSRTFQITLVKYMSVSFSLKFPFNDSSCEHVFRTRCLRCVFLNVEIVCCSYSNLLRTKIYFFIQGRTLNADQIRNDSLSFFRVTDLDLYNLFSKSIGIS